MFKSSYVFPVLALIAMFVITGCAGTKPFNDVARAGETIAIATGWKHEFSRDQLTVTITPSSGSDIVYLPNDAAVRASVNFYADPASFMAVGYETGIDGIAYNLGSTYGQVVSGVNTANDQDWWQTVVFVNLPETLPVGTATVSLVSSGALGESWSVPIEIIEGTGTPHQFEADGLGPMNFLQRHTMERAPNYEVNFSGETIPHAIQIDLTHDAGAGVPYVVNPRGDIKSTNWSDDGENMRVILNLTHENPLRKAMTRFKFYVSGGVSGLQVSNIEAFDVNGAPVAGVSANIVDHF